MRLDSYEVICAQNSLIKTQSDLIEYLFALLSQYTAADEVDNLLKSELVQERTRELEKLNGLI